MKITRLKIWPFACCGKIEHLFQPEDEVVGFLNFYYWIMFKLCNPWKPNNFDCRAGTVPWVTPPGWGRIWGTMTSCTDVTIKLCCLWRVGVPAVGRAFVCKLLWIIPSAFSVTATEIAGSLEQECSQIIPLFDASGGRWGGEGGACFELTQC